MCSSQFLDPLHHLVLSGLKQFQRLQHMCSGIARPASLMQHVCFTKYFLICRTPQTPQAIWAQAGKRSLDDPSCSVLETTDSSCCVLATADPYCSVQETTDLSCSVLETTDPSCSVQETTDSYCSVQDVRPSALDYRSVTWVVVDLYVWQPFLV